MIRPFHILLCDDDQDEPIFFEEALNTLSIPFKLTWIADGEELINALQPSNPLPDIVFLDVYINRVNGLDCLSRIRSKAHLSKLPVIIHTTSSRPVDIDTAFQRGATRFVTKSGSYSELQNMLRTVLTILPQTV